MDEVVNSTEEVEQRIRDAATPEGEGMRVLPRPTSDMHMTPLQMAAERTAFRHDWLVRTVHLPIDGQLDQLQAAGRRVYISSFNLVVGDHLRHGDAGLRDVRNDGRDFVSVLFNAVSLLLRTKKAKPEVALPDDFLLKVFVETLIGPPSRLHATTQAVPVTGYRYWIVSSVPADKLRDFGAKLARQRAYRGPAGGRRRPQPAADDEEGEEADDAPPPPQDVPPQVPAGTLASVRANQWRPLAHGLAASFAEARLVEAVVAKFRAKGRSRGRGQANTAVDGSDGPLAGDASVNIAKLPAFHWVGYKDPVDFHLRGVGSFLSVGTAVVGEEARLAPGRVLDTRPFVTMDNSEVLRIGTTPARFADGSCALNVDTVCDKLSAFVYGMHDQHGRARVHPLQRAPEHYFGGGMGYGVDAFTAADGRDEEEGEQEPLHDNDNGGPADDNDGDGDDPAVATPQTPQTPSIRPAKRRRRLDDDASAGGGDDDEDEAADDDEDSDDAGAAALDALTDAVLRDNGHGTVRRYQVRLAALHAAAWPDRLDAFPFPAHVYELSPLVAYGQAVAWLPFPLPIGTLLTPEQLQVGLHQTGVRHASRKFLATLQLKDIESMPRVQQARATILARLAAHANGDRTLPASSSSSSSSDLYGPLEHTRFDLAPMEAYFASRTPAEKKRDMAEVFEAQQRAVDRALMREHRIALDPAYRTLTSVVTDELTSDDTVSFSEFFVATNGMRDDDDAAGAGASNYALFLADVRRSIRSTLYASILRQQHQHTEQDRAANAPAPTDVLGQYIRAVHGQGAGDAAAAAAAANATTDADTSGLLNAATEELVKQVDAFVDYIDSDLVACDDLLRLRREFQTTKRLLQISYEKLLAELPANDVAARKDVIGRFRAEYWELLEERLGVQFHETFYTSTNLPLALMGETRKFFEAHCTPDGLLAAGAGRARQVMDEKPFVQCMQELLDTITAVGKVTPQSTNPVLIFHAAMLDGATYDSKRDEPATNPLLVGVTAAGKSFTIATATGILVPGTVYNLTNATTHAFNVEGNFDCRSIVIEEFKTGWLIPSNNDKDKGASDEINFFKNRLTRFSVEVDTPHIDKDTGRRTQLKTKSSHHNVVGGATNQHLYYLDHNVERRFILVFVPRHLNAGDGSNPADLNAVRIFENTDHGRVAILRQRLVHALFIYVKAAIKAALIPDVLRASGEIHLDAVFAELRALGIDTSRTTKRHQVLQVAVNVQLYFACWYALFHPFAREFHAQPGAPAPWSPSAVLRLVPINMVLTKDALLYASTLLEHIYAPFYVDATLRTLALHGLHIPYPNKREYLSYMDPTTRNRIYDHDYLVLGGATTETELCGFIVRLNKEFQLRDEDVVKIMHDRQHEFVRSLGYKVTRHHEGRPLTIEPYRAGDIAGPDGEPVEPREMRAVIKQNDPFSKNGKGVRYAVSIAYLEQRLGFSITDAADTIVQRLSRARHVYAEDELTEEFAARYGECSSDQDGRDHYTTMTRAFTRALSRRTLELAPGAERLPDPCFRYVTAYMPRPLSFQTSTAAAAAAALHAATPLAAIERELFGTEGGGGGGGNAEGAEPRPGTDVKTVALNGSFMMLKLTRSENRPPLMRENHNRLPPTAKRTFATFQGTLGAAVHPDARLGAHRLGGFGGSSAIRSDAYSRALGIKAATCDPDYTFACEQMRAVCHPGFPFLYPLLGGRLQGADAPDPGDVPFGFGPMLMAINRALAKKSGDAADFVVYPRDNIYERLRDARAMAASRRDNDANNAYVDIHALTGHSTYGGVTFWDDDSGDIDAEHSETREREREADAVKWNRFMAAEEDAMDIDRPN